MAIKITYTQQGDYLLPDLKLPEQPKIQIGIWGKRHLRYLKNHHPIIYTNLLTSCKLTTYLADINEQAEDMFFRLVKQLAEKEGVTEKLKADNQMLWVARMNNIRNRAMALEGKSNETIARILQERKVLIPMAYWQEKGYRRGGKVTQPNKYRWCKTTVTKILTQQEYCGDIINFKTFSKSYKNKKRYDNPKENWVIFKGVHEPIIDRESFELVQKLVVKTKRRAPKQDNGEKNMFCDFLFCADCGSKLWYHTNTVNKDIHYFSCSNYKKDTRGNCKTRHYIRADAIEQVVMLELRRLAKYLESHEKEFAELLAEKTNADMIAEQKHLEAD